jgi:superfamily I DNA and/or RNA helicase
MPVWLASPESGIPAVYRGSQVIIAGDEKQLPPYNLFQSSFVIPKDLIVDNGKIIL